MKNVRKALNRITFTSTGLHISGFDSVWGCQRKLNVSKVQNVYVACGLNAYNSRVR